MWERQVGGSVTILMTRDGSFHLARCGKIEIAHITVLRRQHCILLTDLDVGVMQRSRSIIKFTFLVWQTLLYKGEEAGRVVWIMNNAWSCGYFYLRCLWNVCLDIPSEKYGSEDWVRSRDWRWTFENLLGLINFLEMDDINQRECVE